MGAHQEHPVVDVHIHLLPPALLSTFLARTRPPMAERRDGWLILDFGDGYVERIDARLVEPERLLESLETAQVDAAVVSINQPGVLRLDAPVAAAVAREANDELADLVGRHRGVLDGLATLPWQDTHAAVEELARADAIGLKGAMVCSNIAGRSLDDPVFDPTFEAAAAGSLPLLLHPTVPAQVAAVQDYGLICAAGFLFDTSTAVLRLVMAGTFEKHPGLKVILAHAGSLLPLLAGRLDREYARDAVPRTLPEGRQPSDYVRRLFTDTIAGSPKALELAIDLVGSDHVCFGSDFPFGNQLQALDLVREAGLAEETLSAVCGGNARTLFNLAPVQVPMGAAAPDGASREPR
ncbi:MAG: amidohydrolase family protein [Acidimicrobiales bacterium]